MTRFKKNIESTCNCVKQGKDEKFVSKTYETRSVNAAVERKGFNTLNLRGNIYFKKVKDTVIGMPLKKKKVIKIEGESKIEFKKSNSKVCDENIKDDNARVLINEAFEFESILSNEIQMNIIESNCIRSNLEFEEFPVSKEVLFDSSVSNGDDHEQKENNGKVQNGDLAEKESNGNLVEKLEITEALNFVECEILKIEEDQVKKEDLPDDKTCLTGDDTLHCNGHDKEALNGDSEGQTKLKKKRKNQVEVLLSTCGDFPNPKSFKRSVNSPKSFSPEPLRRKKKNENLITDEVAEKSLFHNISAKLKKKSGRRRRYKGPIFHYLDVHTKERKIDSVLKIDKIDEKNDKSADENPDPDLLKSSIEPFKIQEQCMYSATKLEGTTNWSNTAACFSQNKQSESNTDSYLLKNNKKTVTKNLKKTVKLKGKRNKITKEKNKSDKIINTECTLDYLGDKVSTLLGCRVIQSKREFLVLFENGTSNWIDVQENGANAFLTREFFQNSEHDTPVLHRLGYNLYPSNNTLDESDSNETGMNQSRNLESLYNDLTDEDYDDVFVNVSHHGNNAVENGIDSECCLQEVKQEQFHNIYEVSSKYNIYEGSSKYIPANLNRKLQLPIECTNVSEPNSLKDLNSLCRYVISSSHIKLYPFEYAKEIVVKTINSFTHIFLKSIIRRPKGESVSLWTCNVLIQTLEDCSVDDKCEAVIISGIEEYFNETSIFEKLLKKVNIWEGSQCGKDVSILRYLIQTLRNFNKPIAAVIKKTASGLPASLLSLFDLVFDERDPADDDTTTTKKGKGKTIIKKKTIAISDASNQNSTEKLQSFVFPRLIGVTDCNESRLMGEMKSPSPITREDVFAKSPCCKTLTNQLRNSVKHMKNNGKIKMNSRHRSNKIEKENNEDPLSENSDDDIVYKHRPNFGLDEKIQILQNEIELEKELAYKSMAELESVINSIDSDS